jgi:hypothetical protein
MSKTLAQYADLLIREIDAFGNTIGGKYSDIEAVEALIPVLRQDAIIIKYNGSQSIAASKKIDYGCMSLPFKITLDSTIQDADLDYLIFKCPRFVNISPKVSGDIYIGAKNKTQSFSKVSSRAEINVLKDRGYLNNGKNILYQNIDTELHVFGNKMLKEVWIEGILTDPQDAPNFDVDSDVYPMSDEVFSLVMDLFKAKLNITLGQAQDNINDNADTISKGRIKQNI